MVDKNRAKLVLEDGSVFMGNVFGYTCNTSGEVVFNTGMVGYSESMTDPSYKDQVLVFTYPLIGNYGIPNKSSDKELETSFESGKIHPKAIIVNEYSRDCSHWSYTKNIDEWMKEEGVPGIEGIDTRELTKKLREKGAMLGKIIIERNNDPGFYDPSSHNLVKSVSIDKPTIYGSGNKKIILIDCGCKNNIIHNFTKRGIMVKRVPWNYDFNNENYDGLFISNGPGDPEKCKDTINNVKKALNKKKPIFGICMGNQILALAAGAKTYKLKLGHRSQNQPCIDLHTKRCTITSQNHGYAVDSSSLPKDWKEWFINANDNTNEGICHQSLPFMSVQFHPEATPGPTDCNYLFDKFIGMLK
ncbi:MAG: glutamine-hydrolyzing carbamoyl-phosphate synthase small subunit [Nanobdellota archaeon]